MPGLIRFQHSVTTSQSTPTSTLLRAVLFIVWIKLSIKLLQLRVYTSYPLISGLLPISMVGIEESIHSMTWIVGDLGDKAGRKIWGGAEILTVRTGGLAYAVIVIWCSQ